MTDLNEISQRRSALERIVAVRKARLKSKKTIIRSELTARFTPKGLIVRNPITAFSLSLGFGFIVARMIKNLVVPAPAKDKRSFSFIKEAPKPSTNLINTVKDIGFQYLTNLLLSKTRDFLIDRLNSTQKQNAPSSIEKEINTH